MLLETTVNVFRHPVHLVDLWKYVLPLTSRASRPLPLQSFLLARRHCIVPCEIKDGRKLDQFFPTHQAIIQETRRFVIIVFGSPPYGLWIAPARPWIAFRSQIAPGSLSDRPQIATGSPPLPLASRSDRGSLLDRFRIGSPPRSLLNRSRSPLDRVRIADRAGIAFGSPLRSSIVPARPSIAFGSLLGPGSRSDRRSPLDRFRIAPRPLLERSRSPLNRARIADRPWIAFGSPPAWIAFGSQIDPGSVLDLGSPQDRQDRSWIAPARHWVAFESQIDPGSLSDRPQIAPGSLPLALGSRSDRRSTMGRFQIAPRSLLDRSRPPLDRVAPGLDRTRSPLL